jgi:hypothetical protein
MRAHSPDQDKTVAPAESQKSPESTPPTPPPDTEPPTAHVMAIRRSIPAAPRSSGPIARLRASEGTTARAAPTNGARRGSRSNGGTRTTIVRPSIVVPASPSAGSAVAGRDGGEGAAGRSGRGGSKSASAAIAIPTARHRSSSASYVENASVRERTSAAEATSICAEMRPPPDHSTCARAATRAGSPAGTTRHSPSRRVAEHARSSADTADAEAAGGVTTMSTRSGTGRALGRRVPTGYAANRPPSGSATSPPEAGSLPGFTATPRRRVASQPFPMHACAGPQTGLSLSGQSAFVRHPTHPSDGSHTRPSAQAPPGPQGSTHWCATHWAPLLQSCVTRQRTQALLVTSHTPF